MSKRIRTILLTALMLLLSASVAFAAGENVYTVSTVDELQYALEHAESGSTVRLANNLTITEQKQLGQYNQMYVYTDITLDMNGKTLRDERIKADRVINIFPEGSLTIIGDGRFESKNHDSDFIQALGPLFIYSGYFGHDPYTWGDLNCPYVSDNRAHETNYRKLGYLIASYISESEGYNGYVTVYGGTFDPGTQNPKAVYDAYSMDTNKHKTCYFMYPLINEGNSRAHGVTIYGGTFITANPANGEGNWCDSPQIKNPFYLNGQNELYVAPSPYTLEETAGNDQRTVYSLNYPVTLTAIKRIKNYTNEKVTLSGHMFELTNQSTGKKITAVTNEKGEAVFSLPLEDAEDTYTLCEVTNNNPQIEFSNLIYEVKIVPGSQKERFKPGAVVYLDGHIVDTIVFENTYFEADHPQTGDNSSLLLWGALLAMTGAAFCLVMKKCRA